MMGDCSERVNEEAQENALIKEGEKNMIHEAIFNYMQMIHHTKFQCRCIIYFDFDFNFEILCTLK